MDGLIESGYHYLEDLADFREWLIEIRDIADHRLPYLVEDGK